MKLGKILLASALALSLAGCGGNSSSGSDDSKVIKIGATPTPHADILNNVVAGELEKEGYTLEVVEFTDYVQPNTALDAGDLDANYFQHIAYMEQFNEENGTNLVAVAGVHLEPMGAWSNTITSIDELKEGDTIAVPNDTTNGSRALSILQDNGLIELEDKNGDGFYDETEVTNNNGYEITAIEAANLPNVLADVQLAVINGNYAVDAGLKLSDAVVVENAESEGAFQYVNYIVVNAGDENKESTQALIKAVQSDAVKEYIEKNYGDSVIVAFTTPSFAK